MLPPHEYSDLLACLKYLAAAVFVRTLSWSILFVSINGY
jgi:hypothetical protein